MSNRFSGQISSYLSSTEFSQRRVKVMENGNTFRGGNSVKKIFAFLIMKTYLYNFDPLKPHFYIVKLGFTGVYIIFLISAQKHRLWVLIRTALGSNEYPQSMF